MNLSIDPQFQALCPRQTDDEIELLTESLKAEGCRDPIVCWEENGRHLILDGMTRHSICLDYEIDFQTRIIDLPSRKDAVRWILRNQLGRRNLTDTQRAILRGRLYNDIKADTAERIENAKNPEKSPRGQFVPLGNAAQEIAKREGVSAKTVKRDGKLAEAFDALSPAVQTQITGTKVADKQAEIKRLAELPENQQVEAAKLIGSGKATTVKAAVAISGKSQSADKLKDAKGRTVPENLVERWKALQEFSSISRQVSAIVRRVKEICEVGTQGAFLDMQLFTRDAKNLKHALKFATPYIVCRYCGGSGCERCKETGFLPESPTTRNAKN